jgi:hypothetical protein
VAQQSDFAGQSITSNTMKLFLFLLATALVSPGLGELYKRVEERRRKDAAQKQEIVGANRSEPGDIAAEIGGEFVGRFQEIQDARPCAHPDSDMIWTWVPQLERWVQHDRNVTALRSIGGG